MKMFTLPNFFTLGNLLCGCLAIVFAMGGSLVLSACLVGIACVCDFLDGFLARALKIDSPIGKQLDSLADVVTFGVVPGVVMFKMIGVAIGFQMVNQISGLDKSLFPHANQFGSLWMNSNQNSSFSCPSFFTLIAFLIPLFSALRLAKFNIDTRQSDSFIGVPTPANAILICSLPLILRFSSIWTIDWPSDIGGRPSQDYISDSFSAFIQSPQNAGFYFSGIHFPFVESLILNPWFLIGITILMSILLLVELPLFALKFKNFGWKGNEIRYIFLALALAMIVVLHFIAIPLVIVLYVLISVVNNLLGKKGVEGKG
jgi:CDP-diacylglycerol--serine O-phosphatidyltransferase